MFIVEKISLQAGLELWSARSAGQRLIHYATGAPDYLQEDQRYESTAAQFPFYSTLG